MSNKIGRLELEEVLNEKQIHHVISRLVGNDASWTLKGSDIRPAMDGIAGFLGDHMKATLHVEVNGEKKKVHLFIKRLPAVNKPKAEYIEVNNFFKREKLMFQVLEEICENGADSWCVKGYIYTDTLLVMPDITYDGYKSRNFLQTLDPQHVFVTTTSIANFHAAFVNYETKKSIDLKRPYNSYKEHSHILNEPSFCESPFLHTCSKLSANLLQAFSTKSYSRLPNLEAKLTELYLAACDSLTEYEDTVNVLLHKDLWVNNIMYKYEGDVPVNAVLIDYQCLRYGPPAFDLMMFLYLTTDRRFREERERDVFDHYYSVFTESLSDDSKERLEGVGYDKKSFLDWCERGRMFGMFETIAIYPFILMDPKTAQETYDNPETYEKHIQRDRSEPVIAHANRCLPFKTRNLEVTEEFVEKYVLDNKP